MTIELVPLTLTAPSLTEEPSAGVTNAISGAGGLGVTTGTVMITRKVPLAWLVSRFIALMSNWLLPKWSSAVYVQWPESSTVTVVGS